MPSKLQCCVSASEANMHEPQDCWSCSKARPTHRAPPSVWNMMRSASPCLRTQGITDTTTKSFGSLFSCLLQQDRRYNCSHRRYTEIMPARHVMIPTSTNSHHKQEPGATDAGFSGGEPIQELVLQCAGRFPQQAIRGEEAEEATSARHKTWRGASIFQALHSRHVLEARCSKRQSMACAMSDWYKEQQGQGDMWRASALLWKPHRCTCSTLSVPTPASCAATCRSSREGSCQARFAQQTLHSKRTPGS